MSHKIAGQTAAEIAGSVRALRDVGILGAGDALPPVRELATQLGVNRNTAVAAYRLLSQAGLVVGRGRGGTVIAGAERAPREGFARDTVLRDIASGNPDPELIPDTGAALQRIARRPVLYGEPVIDSDLDAWSRLWLAHDLLGIDFTVTVTSGAVDAVERLLAQALTRDDSVALEDPCFLASIHTVRLGGYQAVPVPLDDEGMTVDGLRAALAAGVRAVICTPRAQNPTGVSMTPRRAKELRAVLADYPYVLLIEDDHFSMLSERRSVSLISERHERFALIRSVSKFLGPDMSLAIAATDPVTAERLAQRLSPGTTWVSHLLQRLTVAQLQDPRVLETISIAREHYASRNRAFIARLRDREIRVGSTDGLSVWVPVPRDSRAVAEGLMRRGWLARTGNEFDLGEYPSRHLRLTVHSLSDDALDALTDDLCVAIADAAVL